MDVSPSRSSQSSRPSSVSSSLPSFRSPSPRPTSSSSSLSLRSEESTLSEAKPDTAPHLDCLLPNVAALLAQFDRVNQLTEDVYQLEIKLKDAQVKRRANMMQKYLDSFYRQPKTFEVRQRRSGILYSKAFQPSPLFFSHCPSDSYQAVPRTRNSLSESDSFQHQPHLLQNTYGTTKPVSGITSCSMSPAFRLEPPLPWRRAWHSGSSHVASVAQGIMQGYGFNKDSWGFGRPWSEEGSRRCPLEGIPVKRKAWISEGMESEEE